METSILLHSVDKDQLQQLIRSELQEFSKSFTPTPDADELITRAEACAFLKINASTLWHWTKKGIVTAHGLSNRVYYKKSELLNCLQPLK